MARNDRFTSAPIPLPGDRQAFARADLVFYGVDHSGPSFEGRIFFENTSADVSTPLDAEHGYAGSFHIFGHGGCFGDPGHCAVPDSRRDPFDLRPPHQLTPVTKTVIVTAALRRQPGPTVQVTVVPIVRKADGRHSEAVLEFRDLRLLTYAS
jgi:tyrosinase